MTKKQIRIISVAVLTIVSLFYGLAGRFSSEGKSSTDDLVSVRSVNDGDTITIILNNRDERIRLIGIDAPEMGQRPWGKRAKEHLEQLIASSSWAVMLEYDVDRRDKYGRVLAYIRAKDRKLVNEQMLRDGYALLYTFPPNVKHVDILSKAQSEARDRKLGIWGKAGLKERPRNYRKQHPRIN
ncbi:MAG: thermonuclease family protein [Nitrospirae bacterium]|nr:thermonuclease family protein [Nitrospirota bacterium]